MPLQNPFGSYEQLFPPNKYDDPMWSMDNPNPPDFFDKPAPKKPENWVPHYPSQRYVDKNLAPEKTLTHDDVWQLAKARQTAEQKGLFGPDLGQYMLPMAMVEGRSGNFGMNSNAIYDKPSFRKILASMGVKIKEGDNTELDPNTVTATNIRPRQRVAPAEAFLNPTEESTPWPRDINSHIKNQVLLPTHQINHSGEESAVWTQKTKSGNYLRNLSDRDDQYSARMMAALLAEKASLSPGRAEDVVKRYNGSGPMTDQYLRKVQEAHGMLSHPKNDRIRSIFEQAYRRKD